MRPVHSPCNYPVYQHNVQGGWWWFENQHLWADPRYIVCRSNGNFQEPKVHILDRYRFAVRIAYNHFSYPDKVRGWLAVPGKIHSKVGNNHVPILHTAQHKKSFRTPDNCLACPCKLWKKRNKVKKCFNTRQTTKYHMTLSNTLIRNEIKCFNFISVQHICYWKKMNYGHLRTKQNKKS